MLASPSLERDYLFSQLTGRPSGAHYALNSELHVERRRIEELAKTRVSRVYRQQLLQNNNISGVKLLFIGETYLLQSNKISGLKLLFYRGNYLSDAMIHPAPLLGTFAGAGNKTSPSSHLFVGII